MRMFLWKHLSQTSTSLPQPQRHIHTRQWCFHFACIVHSQPFTHGSSESRVHELVPLSRISKGVFRPRHFPLSALRVRDSRRSCLLQRRRLLHGSVLLQRLRRIRHAMLVLHVPAPIVFAREGLTAALLSVSAPAHSAVVLARLVVLVVYVPVQMGFGAEALVALSAFVRALVVALMVAERGG